MKKIRCHNTYQYITSVENLLEAWREFVCGKRMRKDVQYFERHLMENIIQLHSELTNKTYHHGSYHAFNISDPKPRNIHKALVRDRLLHHALYRVLYPFFERTFIADSYSCRNNKGTHKAINKFRSFIYTVSKNHTRTAWVLKCDIKKFFASIDQHILIKILSDRIADKNVLWLLSQIISSFYSGIQGRGLPLGNLTSQLLVNVYMNEFDQFVKHTLKAKYYIRYADDFVILSHSKPWLEVLLPKVNSFLVRELYLRPHPKKVSLHTIASGIDFLGWVHFPDHRTARTTTKHRMFKRLAEHPTNETLQSYLGLLQHGNTFHLTKKVIKMYSKDVEKQGEAYFDNLFL